MIVGIVLPSSLLALATTAHLCLAVLRNHRQATASPASLLSLVSFALGATPWMFPTATGVALGLVGHAVWFAACERLVPARTPGVAARAGGAAATPQSASHRPEPSLRRDGAPPRGFVSAPVLAVFNETADIRTIRVARPDGFEFEAGQFVTVRIRVDGREQARCYSISSAPNVRGYLEISVKRQGVVSNALHAMARPGGSLALRSPTGAFRYPSNDDRPLVLIAGGVGITPLVSMLRHAIGTEPARPVTLLYSARTEGDFAFRDEIVAVARRHPQVRAYFAATRGAASPGIYPGRIEATLIQTTVPRIADSICLLCGPGPMIEAMKTLLLSLGVPPAQIRSEVFEAAIAASAATARPAVSATPRSQRARVMVCAVAGKRVGVRPGQTLLEAAEDGGVEIPSLCRAGVCGTCRVQVTEGQVDCESSTLGVEEQEQGFVLACVTTPRSDCTVRV